MWLGLDVRTWLAIFGAAVTHTIAAIFFKYSAQSKGHRVFLLFATGNLIGLGHMICQTVAMRGNDPKIVLAVLATTTNVIFISVINRVFREKLTVYQWLGLLVMMVGTTMILTIDTPKDATEPTSAHHIYVETDVAS